MKITLKRKADLSDSDPLIVQYVEGSEKAARKHTLTVAIDETIDLADDIAYEVLARHKGMFVIASEANASDKASASQYQGKSLKQYQDKVAHAAQ
jgi:hypothetical protein